MNFSGKSTDHDVAFYKLVPELRQAFHSKKIGRPFISKFISTYLKNPNRFRRTAFNKFRNELTPAFPLLTSIRLRSIPKNPDYLRFSIGFSGTAERSAIDFPIEIMMAKKRFKQFEGMDFRFN